MLNFWYAILHCGILEIYVYVHANPYAYYV